MRAATYARYSTDLQSERSIEDQQALCRAFAERQGLAIVAEFADRARSGASLIGRDGFVAMMEQARSGAFDVLIVEALDRLSRDQEDLAGLWKRLSFAGVEIRAVHEGTADAVQIGVRGLVGALYLTDLAHKVRRGMSGVVRDGRHAGGLAYGYRPVAGQPGVLAIDAAEAETVRRIVAEWIQGFSAREIAGRLNRDRVPPPRGRWWNASTITGWEKRGTGILRNELYAGRLVWNRLRMVKDPDTGRRVHRLNPPEQRQTAEVPHLALVDAETWAAAQERLQARRGAPLSITRRPRHLMSGLLRCGACGAGMSVRGSKEGQRRVSCSRRIESGTCDHARVYRLDDIEAVVVDGLRESLRDPVLIAGYVAIYRDERKRLAREASAGRAAKEKRLATVRRELDRLVDAIASGLAPAESVRDRILALEAEKRGLDADLAAPDLGADVIALHPAAVSRYLAQVETLSRTLRDGMTIAGSRESAAFRELVEAVVVMPQPARAPIVVDLRGRLGALLRTDRLPPAGRYGAGSMVAEVRFSQSRTQGSGRFLLRFEQRPEDGRRRRPARQA